MSTLAKSLRSEVKGRMVCALGRLALPEVVVSDGSVDSIMGVRNVLILDEVERKGEQCRSRLLLAGSIY